MLEVDPARARAYVSQGHWQNISFHGYLERHARDRPQALAVVDTRTSVTWSELEERVARVATGLLDLGLRAGDTVALQIPNRVEFFDARLAVQRIGVRILTLAPDLRDNDLSRTLARSQCRALISPAEFRGFDYCAMFDRVRQSVPTLAWHILVEPSGEPDQPALHTWLQRPADRERLAAVAELPADKVDLLMLTSGTTGAPKLCGRDTNVFAFRATGMNERIGLTSTDRMLSLAPITQGIGQLFGLSCPFVAGATVILMDKFEADEALAMISRHKVTVVAGVPTHVLRMMASPRISDIDLSSLRLIVTGGAGCPPAKQREIEQAFGCPTLNYYGMGEIGIPAIPWAHDPPHIRHETSGRMLSGMELRVVDEYGNDVPHGERGELLVRGPAASSGYLGDDDANAALFDGDGWARSGDLGYLDAEGILHISGRKKDLIIRGGLNIAPKEIEDLISQHPAVRQVAVIGLPDPELGERACAVVSLVPGSCLALDDITGFLRQRSISTYKLPEFLEVRDELPLNPIGKVDVRVLKEQITDANKRS